MISKEWHNTALELRDRGFSGRAIATMIGKSKTQVNDFFKSMFSVKQECVPDKKEGPRILLYDIETAPIRAAMWSMWQQGVGLNQIEDDWFIMSFCAKWLGEDEVFYYDQSEVENMEDDTYLLSKLWTLLNEADVVIGQNIKKFDTKKVNARFILNGFPKPSSYKTYCERHGVSWDEAVREKLAIALVKDKKDVAWLKEKGYTPATSSAKRRLQIVEIIKREAEKASGEQENAETD